MWYYRGWHAGHGVRARGGDRGFGLCHGPRLETEGPFLEAFGAGLLWTLKLRYDFRFFGLRGRGPGTREQQEEGVEK